MARKPMKRKQFQTLIVKASEVKIIGKDLLYEVKAGESGYPQSVYYAPVSENRVFRNKKFSFDGMIDRNGEEIEKRIARCIVFSNDLAQENQKTSDMIIEIALVRGLYIQFPNGEVMKYKRVMRSPSQYRTAKMLMAEIDYVDEIRTYAGYGWIKRMMNQKAIVAKIEPYLANAGVTSSWGAGFGFTAEYIGDYEVELDMSNAIVENESKELSTFVEETGKTTETAEVTDGQSPAKPKAMARVSFRLGMLTKREYRMILKAYKRGLDYHQQQRDDTLRAVWNHVLRGFQFRWGLTKGFLYMEPKLETDKYKVDMLIADGSNKGELDTLGLVKQRQLEMCVANYSKLEEAIWGNLNYQFINALNVDYATLRDLSIVAMEEFKKALVNPEDALSFLGMVSGSEEQDVFDDDTHVDNLRRIILSNPEKAMQSYWVIDKLKNLMEKKIKDMRKGRIPVKESRFVYIITDPGALVGKPVLKPGQYYYNGSDDNATIFRSPLVHKSEPVGIELVNNETANRRFGHLKNILVVNAFDDTLPRMGGADTDGDKVLILFDEKLQVKDRLLEGSIFNSIEKNLPLVYGDLDQTKPPKVDFTEDAIIDYDTKTFKGTDIGIVTTYATTWADLARQPQCNPADAEDYWNRVTIARIVQGKMIDDAKKGTNTNAPKAIKINEQPHWLKNVRAKDVAGTENCYHSKAPLGRLYDYIMENVLPAFHEYTNKTHKKHFRSLLQDESHKLDLALVDEVKKTIRSLEENYRLDINALFKRLPEKQEDDFPSKESYELYEEKRKDELQNLIEHHKDILASYNLPIIETAAASLYVVEDDHDRNNKKRNSYPYVIATDYLSYMLQGLEGNFKLVRINNVDESLFTNEVQVINNQVYDRTTRKIIGETDVTTGIYETHQHKKNFYIKVPYTPVAIEPEREVNETQVQIVLKGFGNFYSGNGSKLNWKKVKSVIENKIIEVVEIENGYMKAQFKGYGFAYYGKESSLESHMVRGKKLQVTDIKEYKGVLLVDVNVVGDVEVTETENKEETSKQEAPATEEQPPVVENNTDKDDDAEEAIIIL